jgi:hypothetical protein
MSCFFLAAIRCTVETTVDLEELKSGNVGMPFEGCYYFA